MAKVGDKFAHTNRHHSFLPSNLHWITWIYPLSNVFPETIFHQNKERIEEIVLEKK